MKKRIIAALMSASMLAGSIPYAFAASDIDNHWAKEYITYLNSEGVIFPNADTGNYSPNDEIMRAEFMRYVNRAFHFTEKAEINYIDVKSDAWYYETVQIAEKYGYIAGVGNNMMDPEGYITREQAATIIGRLYKTIDADAIKPSQLKFTDKANIHDWSASYIYDAVQKGYIVGYPEGDFRPTQPVKRGEIALILYSYLGNSLSSDGKVYTGKDFRNDVENVTISESCTLSDAYVGGDLYITEGLGSDPVTLRNLDIYGTLVISGGNVTLENVNAASVVIGSSMNRLIQVNTTGTTNISYTEVQSTASLAEKNLDVSAGGFSDVDVTGSSNTTVTLDGSLWSLNVIDNASISLTSSANINTLNMKGAGNVTGYGKIAHANILANGSNIAILPDNYELASGVTAIINGTQVQATVKAGLTPNELKLDQAKQSEFQTEYTFSYSGTSGTPNSVTLNGKNLTLDKDYTLSKGLISFKNSFLKTLSAPATHTIEITFSDGAYASLPITMTDSSINTISPASATFDKNTENSAYAPVSFYVSAAEDATVNSVSVNGSTLKNGTDYTYQSLTGIVQLSTSFLEKCSIGTLTVKINMSKSNSVTAQVEITDSTPKNTLSQTEVNFDPNSESPAYQDVRVQLSAVNGAELDKIVILNSSNTVLDEGLNYTVSGQTITLSRLALASQAKNGVNYIDIRFDMNSGVSPVLRVNFVPTYTVRVTAKDDLGSPIKNANITLLTSTSSGNVVLEKGVTDSSGIVSFNVAEGGYILELSGDKFETVTKKINVYSPQDISMSATIKETVSIVVTEKSGALISSAVVTLNNQTATTGADGTVSFTIPRGTYNLTIVAQGYTTHINNNFEVTSSNQNRIILN